MTYAGPKKISNRRLIKAALLWGWQIKRYKGDYVTLENADGVKVDVRSAQCHTGTSAEAVWAVVAGCPATFPNGFGGKRSPSWEEFTQRLRDEENREEEERRTHGTVEAVVAELALQDRAQEEAEPEDAPVAEQKEEGTNTVTGYYRGGHLRHTAKTLHQQVLEALRNAGKPMRLTEIHAQTDCSNISWTSHILSEMVKDGRIVRLYRGVYALSDAGVERPAPTVATPEPVREEPILPHPSFDPEETVDEVLDLLFPDGVKASKMKTVFAWRAQTVEFLRELNA